MQIYNATMDSDEADEYYYFKPEFYESIQRDLSEHYEMFYAVCDEKIIAMSYYALCQWQAQLSPFRVRLRVPSRRTIQLTPIRGSLVGVSAGNEKPFT